MSTEVGAGLSRSGEIGSPAQILRACSTRKGKRPSPRVKWVGNPESSKCEVRRGWWQIEEGFVIAGVETGRISTGVIVDPLKNESGTSKFGMEKLMASSVSDGNGFCIAAKACSTWDHAGEESRSSILCMRSLCSSAATILFTFHNMRLRAHMSIGEDGQVSSIALTDLRALKKSRTFRRCGHPNTISRHFRHTCASIIHASLLGRMGSKSRASTM